MDDLISRQAAIDEIEYELEMINSALDSITMDFNARERLRQRRGEAREILNSIQSLPSVKPEQKKGKWIECERVDYTQFHPDYSSFYSTFRCTSCLKANYRKEKYCPNCGAYMMEEEE